MSTLIEELHNLNQNFLDNKESIQEQRKKDLEKKRQDARVTALNAITDNCCTLMKEAANSSGRTEDTARKEAKLYEWKFSDDCDFNGCYLRDLLNKGNLLEELQMWFDKAHPGPDGSRVFKVYYTMLGSNGRLDSDRRYAIFVSWDQDDWERIDDLIQRTKARFDPSQRPVRPAVDGDNVNVNSRGPRRGSGVDSRRGGGGRGRGGNRQQQRRGGRGGPVAPRATPQGYQVSTNE